MYKRQGDKIGQGRENSKIFLKDNPTIAKEIESTIRVQSEEMPEQICDIENTCEETPGEESE